MSELSKDELLGQVETWLIACKRDTEGVYKGCKECPCKKSCRQAKKLIVALIKKPEVTEEWIESKAFEVYDIVHGGNILRVRKFISSLVKEIIK